MSKPKASNKESASIGEGKRGPGRPKGSPNAITRDLKEMILGALDDAGGRKYLAAQAVLNPGPFLTLVGKCLPREITGKDGAPLVPSVVQFVSPKDAAK
jgi:hypothetical protein